MMIIPRVFILILLIKVLTGNILKKNIQELSSPQVFADEVINVFERNITISPKCKGEFIKYIEDLTQRNIWAVKMFDAEAKLPSGILHGNTLSFGSFDECLAVEGKMENAQMVYGKYCLAKLSIAAVFNKQSTNDIANQLRYKWIDLGKCLPSACSAKDAQAVYDSIIGRGFMIFTEELCQSRFTQPQVDGKVIIGIIFLIIVVGIMVLSTAYDVFLYYLNEKPAHSILIVFSMFKNGKKILTTGKDSSYLQCLDGLKTITAIWIFLLHLNASFMILPVEISSVGLEWIEDAFHMFILASPICVDTFFVISGLLVAYTNLGVKSNKFDFVSFYVRRYIRLTPVLAALMLIILTVYKNLGSGPIWPIIIDNWIINTCKDYWWKTLLHIANFDRIENICIPQSWSVAVDTQFHLLSPLLIIPLRSWPKLTFVIIVTLGVSSIISAGVTVWKNNIYFRNMLTGVNLDYMNYYYIVPWTRAFPWLVGLVLGYCIFKIQQSNRKIVLSKFTVWSFWIISLTTLFLCIFGWHRLYVGQYDKMGTTIYVMLRRPLWSLSIAWIIFACTFGYGGPINWLLTLPIFQVLSKLTYSFCLVQFVIIYFFSAQTRENPKILDDFYTLQYFWAYLAYSVIASLFLVLAFEMPFINMGQIIFNKKKEKQK